MIEVDAGMEAAALWVLQNLGEVGFLGAVVIVAILVIRGDLQLSREAQAGKAALTALPEVNEKLMELRIIAAQQIVRDEWGKRDQEELQRKLDKCLTDLDQCLAEPLAPPLSPPPRRGRRLPS